MTGRHNISWWCKSLLCVFLYLEEQSETRRSSAQSLFFFFSCWFRRCFHRIPVQIRHSLLLCFSSQCFLDSNTPAKPHRSRTFYTPGLKQKSGIIMITMQTIQYTCRASLHRFLVDLSVWSEWFQFCWLHPDPLLYLIKTCNIISTFAFFFFCFRCLTTSEKAVNVV